MSNQNSAKPNQTNGDQLCEQMLALAPAYALGMADADERAFVEANLSRCAEAANELAVYSTLNERMYYTAPLATPSPDLGARIVLAAQYSSIRFEPHLRTSSAPSRPQRAALIVLIAAAFIFLVGVNVLFAQKYIGLQQSQQQAAEILVAQKQLLQLIGAGKAARIDLLAVNKDQTTRPWGTIICDPNGTQGILYVKDFPASASNQSYQLWMREGGKPQSISVFPVDASGSASMVISASQPFTNYEAAGITLEPVGGSDKPTGSPIVRGSVDY